MIGTMLDGTSGSSSNSSSSREVSEVSKTKGCTLPEGDNNEYGGDGDVSGEQEKRGLWAWEGRVEDCRAGEEQTGL